MWVTVALLLGAWIGDMLTPESLVAAILLAVPVALSSVLLEKRFTTWVVVAAIVADVAAGWYNGLHQGDHWTAIAIANRALAAFSIVLVGVLGSIAQTAAVRSGRLAARQKQAERAEAIRGAFERIRSTLNVDLVARAIVREAIHTLGADKAQLYLLDPSTQPDFAYRYDKDADDVTFDRAAPPPALTQAFRRVADGRTLLTLRHSDPVTSYALEALGARQAFVVPLADVHTTLALLVLAVDPDTKLAHEPEPDVWIRSFAEQAATAIAHAATFAELGRKNDELARANRAIDERGQVIRDLVYALSHDLRTPLSAAAMTMQQALDGKYGDLPEPYKEIVRRSIASNSELRRLAETLLMVAKYESGEHSTERGPVQLGAVARSVVDELDPLWHAKGIRMRVGDDETAVAAGDPREIRRAVMNLVANAVSWTPEGGTIAVSVARDGDDVSLAVEDDGYGVPPAERLNLFQRLTTSDASRVGSGSGLGLYIVRRIAENHGGSAAYRPIEPHGSEFSIVLPAYAQVSQHA
jgi:signal transduction histidine kinase